MIVMKFGGTSMGSSSAIRDNVAPIVKRAVDKKQKPVVVVSAMSGVTNRLLAAADLAMQHKIRESLEQIGIIRQDHLDALSAMVTEPSLLREAQEYANREMDHLSVFLEAVGIVGELSSRSHDIVLAAGEKLSAKILSCVLNFQGYPAEYINLESIVQDGLSYDSNAYWDAVETFFGERLSKVDASVIPVLTGFFGPTDQGILEAVGRGYSDFCASLAGAAMKAEEIQIWTDVNGVLSTNPKVVPGAFILDTISYDEMAELSHFGAKVLHPHSVRPAYNAKIPIRILNTFNPAVPGTLVVDLVHDTERPFKSIAYKKNVTIIRICSSRMLMAYGFMEKISHLFARHKVSIDLIATSEVSVSMSVEESPEELQPLLEELGVLGKVTTKNRQSIICIVGTEMQNKCTIQGHVFDVLNENDVHVNMATLGLSLINLSLVVDDEHCEKAVRLLHRAFFKI